MGPIQPANLQIQLGANPADINYLSGTPFAVTLRAGILINDVAIDPDNGDAYFSDSPNCREYSASADDSSHVE
jgi:hypothetical protein